MSRRSASEALMTVRAAVGAGIEDIPKGSTILVACSGGADSLALAGAAAWAGPRRGLRVRAVAIDHGLQDDSARVAAWAAGVCRTLGVEESRVVTVSVGTDGGPEAAARRARYEALTDAASACSAAAVLLGHTLEDQAETVLLRLARGSGARSLAAMRPVSGQWRRPLLSVPRAVVREAAAELLAAFGESPWSDPHNDDPSFARVRVRRQLDSLTAALGPGAVLGLGRSAELLSDDADLLDEQATAAYDQLVHEGAEEVSAESAALARLPRAIRTRVIRLMALTAGCEAEALGYDHVRQLEGLVVDWRGQGQWHLPGGVAATGAYGRLVLHQIA